ncbi:hypothetical protein [Tabrizicola sp.]|uniref:hypothetical protein n=1 Tax=Tabrizicola sp. TaxID=2005166 RepID=UPI0035AEE977
MKTLLPSLRIINSYSFGEEKDGEWLLIECEDTAGQHFTLRIPHQIELGFFARFQAASMLAAEKRRSTPDPELAGAMFAERITVAWMEESKLRLVVKLAMGMELEMHLSANAVDHLRQALDELEASEQMGGPGLTH